MNKRRDRLLLAIAVNQLATPGLGSWMAGHRVAGAGQLIIAFSGFGIFLVHMGRMFGEIWTATATGNEIVQPPAQLLNLALYVIGVAWLWSGITSVRIYREVRELERVLRELRDNPPPRLTPPT